MLLAHAGRLFLFVLLRHRRFNVDFPSARIVSRIEAGFGEQAFAFFIVKRGVSSGGRFSSEAFHKVVVMMVMRLLLIFFSFIAQLGLAVRRVEVFVGVVGLLVRVALFV